jgi:hypothetical protein
MTMTRYTTIYLCTPMGISLMRRAVKGRFSKADRKALIHMDSRRRQARASSVSVRRATNRA